MPGAEKPVHVVTIRCVISERSSSAKSLSTAFCASAGAAASNISMRFAVPANEPLTEVPSRSIGAALRVVGGRKARIAALDARQIGHPLEHRQSLRMVGQQRCAKAQVELMHLVIRHRRRNPVQIRIGLHHAVPETTSRID